MACDMRVLIVGTTGNALQVLCGRPHDRWAQLHEVLARLAGEPVVC